MQSERENCPRINWGHWVSVWIILAAENQKKGDAEQKG